MGVSYRFHFRRGNLFEGIEAQEYIGSRGLGIYWEYRLRNILGVED